jgi:hypothetical protein
MAFRMYFVPVIGTGTKADARRLKYFADGTLNPRPDFDWVDYGLEPNGAVGANLSAAQDAQLTAFPDVNAVPFNLDSNPTTPQATAVQNYLEGINLPAGWVTTAMTWREIVRNVLNMFEFMQAYGGQYSTQNPGTAVPLIFSAGRTLATTWGTLPVAIQNAMLGAARQLGIDPSGVQAGTTLRIIFKSMDDQMDVKMHYNFVGNVL